MAPVLSGGVAPDPPSAADSPGWFRPLNRAAAVGAVDVAGCDGGGLDAAAALSFAVRSASGCMNLAGSDFDALALPGLELAERTVAFTSPTAGTTCELELNEVPGAAVAMFGMAISNAEAIGRARRTEFRRRKRRPFPELRGVPSKVIHPPVMPARHWPVLPPRSPAHDRAVPPVVNSKRCRASKLVGVTSKRQNAR